MLLSHFHHAARYESLHPDFARALGMLRSGEVTEYPTGRHALDGERLALIIEPAEGRGRNGAVLEVHRKFIDIQVCLSGDEVIGWHPLENCREVRQPYDEARDCALFADRPQTWLQLYPGTFAIFWPEDAHAPLAGTGPVQKAVFKVALNW